MLTISAPFVHSNARRVRHGEVIVVAVEPDHGFVIDCVLDELRLKGGVRLRVRF